jgi:glycosyltransferase involved in cell wall biosynthesis
LILFIFTGSFPYDHANEHTFLSPELPYLRAGFEKVILIPGVSKGHKSILPSDVTVEESYARLFDASPMIDVLWKAFTSPELYRELSHHPSVVFIPSALKRLILSIRKAVQTRDWLVSFINQNHLDVHKCIFYTYWLDACTLGIGWLKRYLPGIMLVSRAHGYDLYEERYTHAYIPCREQTLRSLDRLFCASEAGMNYIADKYPWYRHCETARLGVTDPGFITLPSDDGVIRIVSCSFLTPIKRVDLIVHGIAHAARQRQGQRFEWCHLGIGPLKEAIESLARGIMPSNVTLDFPGFPSHEFLMRYYQDHRVDLFLHLSQSEGGCPVAIQEAISCGIPIVATAVGGIPEVVTQANGTLLRADPSPNEIAQAIYALCDNPQAIADKRRQSRMVWQTSFDARINHSAFVARLKVLRGQTS